MQRSLQKVLDELTLHCREEDGEFWSADAERLSFLHEWQTTFCALRVRVEFATADDLLVSAVWCWQDDDLMLHVGHHLETVSGASQDLDQTLATIASEIPNSVTSELLARLG
jgi:hypothetical protein